MAGVSAGSEEIDGAVVVGVSVVAPGRVIFFVQFGGPALCTATRIHDSFMSFPEEPPLHD